MGGKDATAKIGYHSIKQQCVRVNDQSLDSNHRDKPRQYDERENDATSITFTHSKCSQFTVYDEIPYLHHDDLDYALPDASVYDNWTIPRRWCDWMSRCRTVQLRSSMTEASTEICHHRQKSNQLKDSRDKILKKNPIEDETTRRRLYHERLYIVIIVIVSYSENEKHTLCTAIFLFRVLRKI